MYDEIKKVKVRIYFNGGGVNNVEYNYFDRQQAEELKKEFLCRKEFLAVRANGIDAVIPRSSVLFIEIEEVNE